MDFESRRLIAGEFRDCIDRTIERLRNGETNRPFHSALLSEAALFWSRFERSFSTSFGQRVIEEISLIVANACGATEASRQKETFVNLSTSQYAAIEDHVSAIRGNSLGRRPDWASDLADINNVGREGDERQMRVISDLWWVKDGIDHFMSIKTVKPNIDQTVEAKRDLLKLKINDPNCRVFFGLYYNPYGEAREDYAWGPPQGVFNFNADPVVVIGEDYWDTVGEEGVYVEVLEIAEEVGVATRELLIAFGGQNGN